jgi:hypothetical protein
MIGEDGIEKWHDRSRKYKRKSVAALDTSTA